MSKDLAYYQANPDELADMSVEEIEALSAGEAATNEGDTKSGASPDAAVDTEATAAGTEAEATSEAQAAEGAAAAEEPAGEQKEDADGVLSKDGKHVLPFSVLQGTREERARLESLVREQAAEIERMKQAEKDGAKPGAIDIPDGAQVLSEDDLAAVEAEMPALGKILRAQQQVIASMSASMQSERQTHEQEQARQVAVAVQEDIDANPKLAHLQANDPEGFALAVKIDNDLKQHKSWANKPRADRFAAVVGAYEVQYGAIDAPAASPKADAKTDSQPTPTPKPAAAVRRGPASLSDIPGGAPAPVDEMARLEDASAIELTQRFEDMTPEQLTAYLAQIN